MSTWQQSYQTVYHHPQRTHGSPEQWVPPPHGRLKCNVDAAISGNGVAFGVVLRDADGRFIAACNGSLLCDKDPYVAEAMAVKEALTWLKSRGFQHIILESDYLNLCTAFNSLSLDFSYVGLIIEQCKFIVSDIGDVVVCHVRRSANHIAHVLAQATGSSTILGVWDSFPPPCISSLVLS